MRIKGLTTKETSFKTHRNENQTEDTGQNLEYDRCPYLSFFVAEIWKSKIFESTGRRDLNIEYTKFDQLKRQVKR